MPWVRLDEQFPDHPKVTEAGPLASWLHVCGLAFCNRLLTDGFVPYNQVGKLADFSEVWDTPEGAADFAVDPYRLAKKLCDVGMWKQVTRGFLIHDYHEYQPTKAAVMAERAAKAEAGRKGGIASAAARRGNANEAGRQAPAEAPAEAPASGVLADPFEASAQRSGKQNPSPTRPDTDNPKSQRRAPPKSSNSLSLVPSDPPSPTAPGRGRRLPPDFRATEQMHEWAERETPQVAVIPETERFCDYWRAVPGARGRKLDWEATWRNWMRKASDYARPRNGNSPGAKSEEAMLAWLASEEARA